ncbi:DoxX family protein [uncultured Sphingorhabdus sp.]|uniref:DoxX family protein n=1 Tax=uncultured Sphingorhabdus sp. TaxID=1686106 RepID=UPI00262008DD|nr:DoxX family protein [uncultured Sphingorhabdus sp.]HMS20631.1 DoxX family protein [Sphingorhabdus sp.]
MSKASLLERFPFLRLRGAIILARISTALFFMAHAVARIVLGTIPQFGKFMEAVGFPNGVAIVWVITVSEILCGLLLIFGRFVRIAVIPLLSIALGGIVLIHARIGWFVGEHGTGGSEYSVALIVLLLVVAAADGDSSFKSK